MKKSFKSLTTAQIAKLHGVNKMCIRDRASTTHSQMTPEELAQSGIRPNTIRLSIGTEHILSLIHI